jgi:RimJ/RimL family protein N-acetyltransferase
MGDLEILDAKQIRLSEEDIGSIVEIECHPKVQEWLYEYVSPGVKKEFEDYKEFFRKLPRNRKADILIARYKGHLVGFLALWTLGAYMEHVASIGISVHPHYWRKGVATQLIKSAIELARTKKLRRLEVETLSENAPMRYIVEKLGFRLESLRKNRIKKGELLHDEAVYCLLL